MKSASTFLVIENPRDDTPGHYRQLHHFVLVTAFCGNLEPVGLSVAFDGLYHGHGVLNLFAILVHMCLDCAEVGRGEGEPFAVLSAHDHRQRNTACMAERHLPAVAVAKVLEYHLLHI